MLRIARMAVNINFFIVVCFNRLMNLLFGEKEVKGGKDKCENLQTSLSSRAKRYLLLLPPSGQVVLLAKLELLTLVCY